MAVQCAHCISINMTCLLSTYGGALANPEYVRMVAPRFEPRKKVAQLVCSFERRSKITHALLQTCELYCACLAHFLGIFVSGKGASDLCEENLISSIRWTTQFALIRLSRRFFMGNASQINSSRNSVRVERRSDLRVRLRRGLLYI